MPIDHEGGLPWHPREWTVGEVLALPEDHGQRVELMDGSLMMSPSPAAKHQRIQHRIQVGLDGAVPAGFEVLPGINVVLNPSRLLIPDVAVVSVPDLDTLYFDAAHVDLVVEIVSPSSRVHDRAYKRVAYAEAGIRHYVLVDSTVTPVRSQVFRLDGGEYAQVGDDGVGVLRMTEPFPVAVDFG